MPGATLLRWSGATVRALAVPWATVMQDKSTGQPASTAVSDHPGGYHGCTSRSDTRQTTTMSAIILQRASSRRRSGAPSAAILLSARSRLALTCTTTGSKVCPRGLSLVFGSGLLVSVVTLLSTSQGLTSRKAYCVDMLRGLYTDTFRLL
jgi:hypothetical protein